MLFNSLDFAIFLPVVFVLYWFVTNHSLRLQNVLIVVASYVFYGWWDWRFLSLILFSTVVDYSIGVLLQNEQNELKRKFLPWTSIVVNLGFLGVFKYYNFFIESFTSAFSFLGVPVSANSLDIILPVGISFYTFQTLSYTIDVYKKELAATRDFVAFSAFVSFFPQLVAGPIERAGNLLPQFYTKRTFDHAKAIDGLRQMLWGLFKKVVIADNCAQYANEIFNHYSNYSGSTLLLGAVLFAFQIYGDFSGYSDIAIGTSRLFGFNLMQNFAFPYFSRDIAEFWRRWHISLSTWFRDYLYIPLGGSRGGNGSRVVNTFIIFVVSGFWHGANWTFIVWGALNALYFLPLLLANKNRTNLKPISSSSFLPSVQETASILSTFFLVVLAWIFFRAENLTHAFNYIIRLFDLSLFKIPEIFPLTLLLLLSGFITIEWIQKTKQHGLQFDPGGRTKRPFRWTLYLALTFSVAFFFGKSNSFIYFQF